MTRPNIPSANIAHMTIQRHDNFRNQLKTSQRNLGGALESFLVKGRSVFSSQLEKEINDSLPDRESALVKAAMENMRMDLERMPSLLSAKKPGQTGAAEIRTIISRAGQILLALRLDGEDERLISYLQGAMARLIEESAWAVQINEEAMARNVTVAQLAPSALAAALFERPITQWNTASDAVKESGLLQFTNLDPKAAASAAESLWQRLKAGDQLVVDELENISKIHLAALERKPVTVSGPVRFGMGETDYASLTGQTAPIVDIKVLSGFLASGRGGSEQARLEGVVALIRDIGVALRNTTQVNLMPWDNILIVNTLHCLTQLTNILKQERLVHRKIEHLWRAMDDKVSKAPKKEHERVIIPLPKIDPMEARAMYYQHALVGGMPLSLVLAEVYDSEELTFGPTEKVFFERLSLYAARKYAADLASSNHAVFKDLEDAPTGIDFIRSLVRGVESNLRRMGQLSDEDLKQLAKDEIGKLGGRELRMNEIKKLTTDSTGGNPSLIDEMVLRIRAEQEVRIITAQLPKPGGLSQEFVASLKQLPHARFFAKQDRSGDWFWDQVARNGQSLQELDSDTRSRWSRHRQEASAYKDVSKVNIPGSEDDVASYNPLGVRAVNPGRREADKDIVDPDDPFVKPGPKAGARRY